MNVVRTFPLILLATALTACAGKPARSDAPVASTVVAPGPAAEAPAATADTGVVGTAPVAAVANPATPAAAAPTAAPQGAEASPPTTAASSAASDDDFDALYGGTGDTGSAAAYDPWEPFNRKVHKFNNAVDRGIARPLATAYTHVVPRFARTGVSNFFSNLRAPL